MVSKIELCKKLKCMFIFSSFINHFYFHRPQKIIWHGAYTNGKRSMDSYCDAWNTGSTDKVGLASSLFKNKLLSQEEFSCSNRFAVLCIEVTTQQSRRRRRRRYSDRFANELDEDSELSPEEYQILLDSLDENN